MGLPLAADPAHSCAGPGGEELGEAVCPALSTAEVAPGHWSPAEENPALGGVARMTTADAGPSLGVWALWAPGRRARESSTEQRIPREMLSLRCCHHPPEHHVWRLLLGVLASCAG